MKRSFGKGMDSLSDSSKSLSSKTRPDGTSAETEIPIPNLPVIEIADNAKHLPRYHTIINRTDENGVGMEDLDQLQQDLEKLLSTCAVRLRVLRGELDEDKKGEKGKSSAKRKRPDNRLRLRETKNRVRILKAKHYGMQPKFEPPELPRSDLVDQFWHFVDQYCPDVTVESITFLDELIQQCVKNVSGKIPELGEHYALEWAQQIIGDDPISNSIKLAKTKGIINGEVRKNGYNAMLDMFASPLTQRLVSAFVEEKVMTKFPVVTEKLKPSDLSSLKTSATTNPSSLCMELVEQGVLKPKDVQKVLTPEDEILQEIRKCKQELAAVNEHNVQQLNKLKDIVTRDQRKVNVKIALRTIDKQVDDMYKKLLIAKQKAVQQQVDDGLLPQQRQYIDPVEADKIIDQQTKLSRIYFRLCKEEYEHMFFSNFLNS